MGDAGLSFLEGHERSYVYRALATLVFGDPMHAALLEQIDDAQRRRFGYHYAALRRLFFWFFAQTRTVTLTLLMVVIVTEIITSVHLTHPRSRVHMGKHALLSSFSISLVNNDRCELAVTLLSITDALQVGVALYSPAYRDNVGYVMLVRVARSEVALETAHCFGKCICFLYACVCACVRAYYASGVALYSHAYRGNVGYGMLVCVVRSEVALVSCISHMRVRLYVVCSSYLRKRGTCPPIATMPTMVCS